MEGKRLPPPQHQVFINFRGDELRNGFIGHLEKSLKSRGINAFIDTDARTGEDIKNLFNRIEDSRIAIVVFSSRYTESRWCLDELVKIKECADQGMLEGTFGDHFRDREREYQYELPKIKKWKDALESISCKIGLPLTEGSSEFKFLVLVNKKVLQLLESIPPASQTRMSQIIPFSGKRHLYNASIPSAAQTPKSQINPFFRKRVPFPEQSQFEPVEIPMRHIREEIESNVANAFRLLPDVSYSPPHFGWDSSGPSNIPSFPSLPGPMPDPGYRGFRNMGRAFSGPGQYSCSVATSTNGGPVYASASVWHADPEMTPRRPNQFQPMETLSIEDDVNDQYGPRRMSGSI